MHIEPEFKSRRSAVYGKRGMVATSQPMAVAAGLEILSQGGNAADAAVATAAALNVISKEERDIETEPFEKIVNRERAVRPFLDHLFRPDPSLLVPTDDQTVVCRCEEVTAGEIRQILGLGALGPNQLKSQIRSGMGPCQGRMCGLTVSEIIAAYRGVDVSAVGYFRIRPPIKPITVEQLANLELAE